MQIVHFDNDLSLDSVNLLINEIEECNSPVVLYFTTNGGSVASSEMLIHYLNSTKKKVKIIVCGHTASAGLDILLFTKCIKEALPSASGMMHQCFMKSGRGVLKKSVFNSKLEIGMLHIMDYEKEEYLQRYRSVGISEEILKSLKEGKEIYLNNKELKEILVKSYERIVKKSICDNDIKR